MYTDVQKYRHILMHTDVQKNAPGCYALPSSEDGHNHVLLIKHAAAQCVSPHLVLDFHPAHRTSLMSFSYAAHCRSASFTYMAYVRDVTHVNVRRAVSLSLLGIDKHVRAFVRQCCLYTRRDKCLPTRKEKEKKGNVNLYFYKTSRSK